MALFRRGSRAAGDSDQTGQSDQPADLEVEVVRPSPAAEEPDLPASRMRGTEPLYGYVVGLELLVVAILNTVITTGKGAPAHPQTWLHIVGIVASVGFFGVLQSRHRTIVGFSAIIAAFFVTMPKVPNSLGLPHILALAFPMVYALIITQRQRRALTSAMKAGRGSRGRARTGGRADARAAGGNGTARSADRRRGGKAAAAGPAGPRASARYTPPKAKRGKGRVSGR